jgi:hypothetical protein
MADRTESFSIAGNHLIRSVVPARGQPYEHRCPRSSFEEIAHVIDELNRDGRTFTLEELVEITDLPSSQIAVALAFMKERGCVVTQWRRNSAACSCLFEDAMTEYWALAEKGP